MNSQVCVDSSFILKLGLPEEDSDKADELWNLWTDEAKEIVAPTLLWYEVTSTLRNKVHEKLLALERAREVLHDLIDLPVSVVFSAHLLPAALEFANRFNRPNAYDAQYLAVSTEFECPFWTADRRLYNAARGFPRIRLLSGA